MKLIGMVIAVAIIAMVVVMYLEKSGDILDGQDPNRPGEAEIFGEDPNQAPAGGGGVKGVIGAPDRARIRMAETEMSKAIRAYQATEGRLPSSLDALRSGPYGCPSAPPGHRWDYNPATGQARAVRQ